MATVQRTGGSTDVTRRVRQVVRAHVVSDLDQLPDGFRRRVQTTAAVALSSSYLARSEHGDRFVAPSFFDRLDEVLPGKEPGPAFPVDGRFLLMRCRRSATSWRSSPRQPR
jgi:hypothetical protein